MKRKVFKVLGVFILLQFLCFSLSFAEGLNSIGFLSGYMEGDLKAKDDYEVAPLMVSFGFDLKPLAKKIGINTEGTLEFQVEPFLSPVIEPKINIETGINLLFKYAFPLNKKLMPYIKFGAGPSFMSLHTREQSTQFNFVSSGCVGFSWFLNDTASIDCEYRFRHLSNASIDSPNSGINTQAILIGFSYHFK